MTAVRRRLGVAVLLCGAFLAIPLGCAQDPRPASGAPTPIVVAPGGATPARGSAEDAEADLPRVPVTSLPGEACAQACAHALAVTLADLDEDVRAAVGPDLRAVMERDCPRDCLDRSDAGLRCVRAATDAAQLGRCPR